MADLCVNFQRNGQTVSQIDCTILQSCQGHRARFPHVLHIRSRPEGVKRRPTEVLSRASLTAGGVEQLFMCLLATCVSSLDKWLSNHAAHFFKIRLFTLLVFQLCEFFIYSGY